MCAPAVAAVHKHMLSVRYKLYHTRLHIVVVLQTIVLYYKWPVTIFDMTYVAAMSSAIVIFNNQATDLN